MPDLCVSKNSTDSWRAWVGGSGGCDVNAALKVARGKRRVAGWRAQQTRGTSIRGDFGEVGKERDGRGAWVAAHLHCSWLHALHLQHAKRNMRNTHNMLSRQWCLFDW